MVLKGGASPTSPSMKEINDTSDTESARQYEPINTHLVRNQFIAKVYGILAAQFALTTVVILVIRTNVAIEKYFLEHQWIFWVFTAGYFGIYMVLACHEESRRKVPLNFILLFAFTFMMSVLAGFLCLYYDTPTVLYAAGLTMAICLMVSLFSYYTSFDFTKWIWIMFIVLIVFMVAGFAMIFIPNQTAQLIYSAFGVAIFTIFLAIHTQYIIGGREVEISPEEYILATIMLYLDIMYIFLNLLRIIQSQRS